MASTNHYLFIARSVTHAQQMAKALERSGVPVRVRRVGSGLTRSGCGYTLQVAERQYARASELLAEAGHKPVKVYFVSGGMPREVIE